ncbi:GNAT family N-acetyltransferase [Kangiella shandongensis]|uniref:GNAT family N-acetyltransferase n=1 Tax=Kangiella shandongensis TaxID=2763258 RepID=UPI001CC165A8|nr:GNAT family N-acetyltransferase [Kangiella shandongensis]
MLNSTPETIETPFKQYPDELLYQYHDAETEQTFELRKLDIKQDLERFHHWHNQQYVYEFWELNQSKEELKNYLVDLESKDFIEPVIGSINGTPCAYFEVYWAYYDRIAPYCDATLFDRGYHLLIGEKQFLGQRNTMLWLNIVNDFIFKDEPRTERIVGEPRADNVAILKYLDHTPFTKKKEFDFPHKRAALLECFRDTFYQETILNQVTP